MNKILELGRKAFFIARVITGYEERRIRAHRLMLQKQIQEAQAKKDALRRVPEQVILTEVRRMVEEMQSVLRKFEETEAAIEEYLKPLDKNAQIVMNMQLEKEEKSAKEILRAMHQEAILKKFDIEKEAGVHDIAEMLKSSKSSSTADEEGRKR